ncbi:retrotransposon hot spot protein (RHS) [Trypanosoma vivax Y486]|uniref:Retrotransposon hot spot protein (RHS) n=1 Tax=Trypanosoma vivax (strain Y486) TaxID=1055687 RepID=F9WVT7_TRYVY|nr:retrotransposon hot spot protein (RHS) [Trypanosoma vivax Y486]|eukprot:CCD21698.1 retrotransposon hot spot protein (RHS) [Trypanosoma vivax Y486]
MLLLCLLEGARLALAERAALSVGGCQHVGQARTPYCGGAPILAGERAGVEVGVLDRKVPGRATVTLRPSAGMCLTIASAYFPRKPGVSSASMNTLPGASGPLAVGAGANSHHVLWDPFRPSDGKGECIVDWCVQNGLSIANAGSATRRQPGTAALSSPEITLCRDCEVCGLKSALSPHSDHYWITFDAFVGASLDVIAPSKHARATHAWNKARWHEFRKLSDEFIFRGMERPAKAADAPSDAVTRGIRMAAKRTFPKGKGMAPPFWTPELTKLDVAVQERKNERKRDALIRWRRKVLADPRWVGGRRMCRSCRPRSRRAGTWRSRYMRRGR